MLGNNNMSSVSALQLLKEYSVEVLHDSLKTSQPAMNNPLIFRREHPFYVPIHSLRIEPQFTKIEDSLVRFVPLFYLSFCTSRASGLCEASQPNADIGMLTRLQ